MRRFPIVAFFILAILAAIGSRGSFVQAQVATCGGSFIMVAKFFVCPSGTPTLPPMGVYNGCEIDTNLSGCEAEDLAMTSDGYTYQINYLALAAHKTGSNSLTSWFAYDAGIGMHQLISVKLALTDPTNVLTGTSMTTNYTSLASDCGATNNEQLIACAATVCDGSVGCAGWYLYDEPGCPNQGIGYCAGSMAGSNYQNVNTLAAYIAGIDSHPIYGIQTPSGIPASGGCGAGGWVLPGGGNTCAQTQINNLFSCNAQSTCNGNYSWITDSTTPLTGYDDYPFCTPSSTGTICAGASVDDVGIMAQLIQTTILNNYPSEKIAFVGQAFSWFQEGGPGCSTYALCNYPTQAQMQNERDQALYWANHAGNPINLYFWYYWPDITCINTYTGCSATTNRAAVAAASFAAFPATPPP